MAARHSLARAFGCAFAGVGELLRGRNARVQVGLGVGAIALGAWLGLSATEWAVVALTIGLVLAAEAGNTAVEHAVDVAMPEVHPIAKKAKDVAAGAVLLASMAAVAVGCLVFAPKIWERL